MITVVDRVGTHWVERPWLRFLLGDVAGDVVPDPGGTLVAADSLVVSQRPDLIPPHELDRIRRTPNVGLFHISDEWYRRPLASYAAFSYVLRQHLHSGLRATGVRAVPLGPACLRSVEPGLAEASLVPLADRAHRVSFSGKLVTTRFAAASALSTVPGAWVRPSGRFRVTDPVPPDDYMTGLRASAFVACPMGNVHLESFRVYEALEAGAIPIVERRRRFDYFALLLGPYPFPSVRSWSEAPAVIARFGGDEQLHRLQEETRSWWQYQKLAWREAVQADATGGSEERVTVHRGSGRLAGARELVRHHNLSAAGRRAELTAVRLRRRIRPGAPC